MRGLRPIPLTAIVMTFVVVVAACSSGGGSSQFKGKLKAVQERGELRVGVGLYAPFAMEKPGGGFEGIDIEILERLGKKLGVKTVFVNVPFDALVAGVGTGKFDMTTALCVNAERDKVVDYAAPLYSVGLHWAVRTDNPKNLKTMEDINKPDVTVLVGIGSFDETAAQKYLANANIKAVAVGGGVAQFVAELIAGRTDVISLESPVNTRLYKSIHGDAISYIPPADQPLQSDPVGYTVPDGDKEFADYVTAFEEELRKSGEIDKLFDKYAVPEFIAQ